MLLPERPEDQIGATSFARASTPTLKAPVTSGGMLEGRFEKDQIARIARAIQELRSPLTVVSIR